MNGNTEVNLEMMKVANVAGFIQITQTTADMR